MPQREAPARGLTGIAVRATERPLADHLCALRAFALKPYTFDLEQSESSFSFPAEKWTRRAACVIIPPMAVRS